MRKMVERLKSYRNGVHGPFFISVADELERLQNLVGCEWRKEPPNENGWWWWWNEDGLPVPVSVEVSLTNGVSYFATAGQLGWNRFQKVEDMGGMWMRLEEPATPEPADYGRRG